MGHVDMKIQFLFLSKTLMEGFINWFQSHEARLDTSALGITAFSPSEGGRGAIALMDIPVCGRSVLFPLMDYIWTQEGHVLFSIPRSLTLSTRTSQLPLLFGFDAWQKASLHHGWSGLILCMMWEQASGPSSKWQPYLGDRIIVFTISRWLV